MVKFCCTLICMLVIIFFSRLRRLWLPTGISERKRGQFGFLKLQGQYIYNHRDGTIYPLDIRCGSQNGWHHFFPLCLILGFEENSLELSCLPEGWKSPQKGQNEGLQSTIRAENEQFLCFRDYPFKCSWKNAAGWEWWLVLLHLRRSL